MKIDIVEKNNAEIAIIESNEVLMKDTQSALDLMATVEYETGCTRFIVNKFNVSEDFFDLSTKLAGDILQKFINYRKKLAIVGDFSMYNSKSLKDFIYESNQGKDIFFVSSKEQAIEKLSEAL